MQKSHGPEKSKSHGLSLPDAAIADDVNPAASNAKRKIVAISLNRFIVPPNGSTLLSLPLHTPFA
ncbi:TPA: hypothetical protein ACITTS_001439, partial [Salmonella enterica subsp. enterica serovar Virchow]